MINNPVAAFPRAKPVAGQYANLGNAAITGTSNTTGAGYLRLYPVPVFDTWTIDRLGAEITSAGTAGSLLRLGIYADNGSGLPGALVLDAGTILGDSATVQALTVSKVLLPGLYWFGGALQGTLTSQPTIRTVTPPMEMPGFSLYGTSIPTANSVIAGYLDTGPHSGALPANYTATPTLGGYAPRCFVRFA